MTLALQLALLLGLLAVCSTGPGVFLLRRFRWSPIEKLVGGVALSLIVLYLAAWTIYLLVPQGAAVAASAIVSLACAALAFLAGRDFAAMLRSVRSRRTIWLAERLKGLSDAEVRRVEAAIEPLEKLLP